MIIDLSGKTTLVIGGSRGIGAAIVKAVLEAGGNAAWTYPDNPKDISSSKDLEGALAVYQGKFMHGMADCTNETATRAFVASIIKKFATINSLVYCAGYTCPVGYLDIKLDEWRRVLDINLSGAFIATQAVLPKMKEQQSGAIVLIGSAAIVAGGGGRADYVSAKAAMEGLNRAITKEFAPSGIRCNLVHPSLIDTDLLKERHPDPEKRKQLAQEVPLKRLGQPEDIANATLFLLSDMASYITGQSLFVDGGRTFCK